MEEKLTRECRQFVEKLFKKYDTCETGAVTREDMRNIVTQVLDKKSFDKAELDEVMANHAKESKYTVHNRATNKFEMKYRKDTIDFPSCLAIAVQFLMKHEKKNQFSGTNLVRLGHFDAPKVDRRPVNLQQKRRIF